MKRIITQTTVVLFILLSVQYSAFAQADWLKTCGTVYPTSASSLQPDTIVNGDSVIIVPVVFHIITQGTSENISKSQVNNALQNLNRYLNRLNPDTSNIPASFQAIRGNPKIELRLARIDPQGNCTDGIDRIYSPLTYGPTGVGNHWQMQPNFDWDHIHYLNIYVVNYVTANNELVGGISYLPPIDSGQNYPAFNDALTIGYNYMGDGLNGDTLAFFGSTLAHEMGHDLGLLHIWGSGPGCNDDDDVSDTPLQDLLHMICPQFPSISCNNGPDGDMFMNLMDYTLCRNIFSEGQADRMRVCLANNDWRRELWTPANLIATGVDSIIPVCSNPPVADFGYGNFAMWLTAGQPIQFYEASTWTPTSYQWTFNGGLPATSTDTFPRVIFPDSGMYNVQLIVSNSFGTDTISKMIRIEPAAFTYNTGMIEDFEDTTFNKQIPSYTLRGKKWAVTDLAAYSGSRSIRLDQSLQFHSAFFTHTFDLNLLPGTGRVLEFQEAMGVSATGTIGGGLRVIWKRPYDFERFQVEGLPIPGIETGWLHGDFYITDDSLKTVITNAVFIPTLPGQWKKITFPIPDSLSGNIQIGFDWTSLVATNKLKGFYIDDIKILYNPTGVAENNDGINWTIFPNPATDYLTISIANKVAKMDITIFDITGKTIFKTIAFAPGSDQGHKIEVNTSDFAAGVYLVQIQTEDFISTKKVIVSK